MATRGVIAYAVNFLEKPIVCRKYKMALNYLHYDSDIDCAGITLLTHYSNINDLMELLEYAENGIKSLGSNLSECEIFTDEADMLQTYNEVDTKDVMVNFAKYIKSFGGDIEYAYLFIDYTWYVYIRDERDYMPITCKLLPKETTFTQNSDWLNLMSDFYKEMNK